MSVSQEDLVSRLKACSAGALWLLLAVALLFLATAGFAYFRSGVDGVIAAAIAGLLCLVSASAALFATGVTAGTPNATAGIFAGMILRTALPFFITIFLVQAFGPLAESGLFAMVLLNYLLVLAVETVLAVRVVQSFASTVVRQ